MFKLSLIHILANLDESCGLLLDLSEGTYRAIYREGVRVLILSAFDKHEVSINPILDLIASLGCYGQLDTCTQRKLIPTCERLTVCCTSNRSVLIAVVEDLEAYDTLREDNLDICLLYTSLGWWCKMFIETLCQFLDALFQFLPSGGVNGCNSHFVVVLFALLLLSDAKVSRLFHYSS